ncbi:MFS transporter [Paenibacillus turpanensis]|uniref:MFS transporter n=1 Tax=Paenibacillus turpanensis TaxID=2689078 RepID=UPI001FB64FD1|nr:MFS transporter [Paenibacillus turpanensis]
MERRLSGNAKLSLAIHWCFTFGSSMSGVFLSLYLWRLTNDLWVNGMYQLISFACTPLGFALGGLFAKKKGPMATIRVGIALTALFYLAVVIVQTDVVKYYVWFAIFQALAGSFYWVSYITLMYDVSTDQNRLRYLALNMITFTTGNLAGPALAGAIIAWSVGLTGYIFVFTLSFIMFVMTALLSTRLRSASSHHKSYYLKYTGLLMKRSRRFTKMLFGFFTIGLFQGIILFLPNILLFEAVGREDAVGYIGMGLAALTVTTGWLISKYGRESSAQLYVKAGAVGLIAGTVLLVVDGQSLWTILLFMSFQNVCFPLIVNTLSAYQYRIIGGLPLKGNLRIETVVLRESFLNAGRMLGTFGIILFSAEVSSVWIGIILLAAASAQLLLGWLIEKDGDTLQRSA